MIKTYILLIMFSGSEKALDHITFYDRSTCEAAKEWYVNRTRVLDFLEATCIESREQRAGRNQ